MVVINSSGFPYRSFRFGYHRLGEIRRYHDVSPCPKLIPILFDTVCYEYKKTLLLIMFRDLAELTEKLNSIIKKELRRRSDIQNLRGFVDDDDQIGHLLAKHYDLESDQNSIVPVVQKKRICESVQDDISSKNETKIKLLQEQTDMLNGIISNIDENLRNGLNPKL